MLGETQMDDLERYVAKRSQENPSFAETIKKPRQNTRLCGSSQMHEAKKA